MGLYHRPAPSSPRLQLQAPCLPKPSNRKPVMRSQRPRRPLSLRSRTDHSCSRPTGPSPNPKTSSREKSCSALALSRPAQTTSDWLADFLPLFFSHLLPSPLQRTNRLLRRVPHRPSRLAWRLAARQQAPTGRRARRIRVRSSSLAFSPPRHLLQIFSADYVSLFPFVLPFRYVAAIGEHTNTDLKIGDPVGVKWLADSCLRCEECRKTYEVNYSSLLPRSTHPVLGMLTSSLLLPPQVQLLASQEPRLRRRWLVPASPSSFLHLLAVDPI
jgi:hypothetical protein